MLRQRMHFLLYLGMAAVVAGAFWRPASSGALAMQKPSRAVCLSSEGDSAPHAGMAWVSAGRFPFGDTVYPEEGPVRTVQVSGFWMDRTEVTNAQFRAFIDATAYVTVAERAVDMQLHRNLPPDMQKPGAVVFTMPQQLKNSEDIRQWWRYVPGASWRRPGGPGTDINGLDEFPVVNVTYEDALAYAHWRGRDLPSEMEFEWAARGGRSGAIEHGQPREANTWQGTFPTRDIAQDGFSGLAPVGCFQPNGYGLYDLIGNAWEITRDIYKPTHDAADNTPPDQPSLAMRPDHQSQRHVIKGGSYLCAPNYCMRYRPGARQGKEDDLASNHVGFRTVVRAAHSR